MSKRTRATCIEPGCGAETPSNPRGGRRPRHCASHRPAAWGPVATPGEPDEGVCVRCGAKYETYATNRKYCSAACGRAVAEARMTPEAVARRSERLAQYNAARRAARSAERAATQTTCLVCAKEFTPEKSVRQMYCSPSCQRWAGNHLNAKVCTELGCVTQVRAKGLCATHYNQKFLEDRHSKVEVECSVCGTVVLKARSNNKSRRPVCSYACRAILQGKKPRRERSTELVGPIEIPPRPTEAPTTVVRSAGGFWTSGRCAWCEGAFTCWSPGTPARYCSKRCSSGAAKAAHGRRFAPSPVVRREIYERDDWVCQLCFEPVDGDLPWADQWAATLDHIIPRSKQAIPDDSPANLRLAHRWCNAVRGNESYYTAADLAA